MYNKPKLIKYAQLKNITFSNDGNEANLVSDVSSQIAAMALKESYDNGNEIEIPSLGIKIKK